ncbi:MAG: hypothetical protein ABW133_04115 [Polyangiaceae bacterium]
MRQSQSSEKLEEVARQAGAQWGSKMRAQYLRADRTIGSWPGTLDDARRLIDSTVNAELGAEERELLALLAERGARRVWNDFASSPPISTVQAISELSDELPGIAKSRFGS